MITWAEHISGVWHKGQAVPGLSGLRNWPEHRNRWAQGSRASQPSLLYMGAACRLLWGERRKQHASSLQASFGSAETSFCHKLSFPHYCFDSMYLISYHPSLIKRKAQTLPTAQPTIPAAISFCTDSEMGPPLSAPSRGAFLCQARENSDPSIFHFWMITRANKRKQGSNWSIFPVKHQRH